MTTVFEFLQAVWLLTAQMAPWLLLGFLVAGLLSVYVSTGWLRRHLGGGGAGPVWKASLFGVPLPLCSCGVVPVAASLRRSGASPAATTAFLISTPQTGVDSIAVTGALLGPVFAVFRPLAALLTGVLGGALAGGLGGGGEPAPEQPDAARAGRTPRQRLGEVFRYGFEVLPRDIGKALIVGLLLAGVITALVPAGSLAGQLGGGLLPIIVMMAVSVPLYVCATGSVPLAAGFIHAGVSPGAALAFLIAGPATNAAAVTVLVRILGRRTTIIYLVTIGASAILGGVLLDALFGGLGLHLSILHAGHEHGQQALGWLDHAWAGLLAANLAWALRPGRRRNAAAPSGVAPDGDAAGGADATGAAGEVVALAVEGMTCSHCRDSVERTLAAQKGVRRVRVDLPRGRAFVEGEALDARALQAAVGSLGYDARLETGR